MFYYIYLLFLETDPDMAQTPMRLFRFVTFRAGGAAFSAFVLAVVFGQLTVGMLKRVQFVAPNRLEGLVDEDDESINQKKNVPSMGGILIVLATLISILMWANLANKVVLIFLGLMLLLGIVGFVDDYLKVVKKSRDGMSGKVKLACQVSIAVSAVWLLDYVSVYNFNTGKYIDEALKISRSIYLPFIKQPILLSMPLAAMVIFGSIVVIGSSNAVNLSDGMDGLASGCTVICALTYACFAYFCGHANFSEYLSIPNVNSSEVTIIATAIAGASLGFLWHNCYPASMFMGDTGSLALGGAIGLIAVLVKQELLLVIVGGIFVIEAGSVILQVTYYKLTRKFSGTPKRLFKCAPIHHHFKMIGWPETQIVIRFWIIAIVLAAVGLASLKMR